MKKTLPTKLALGAALVAMPGMAANASNSRWRGASSRQGARAAVVEVVAAKRMHSSDVAQGVGDELALPSQRTDRTTKSSSPFAVFGRSGKKRRVTSRSAKTTFQLAQLSEGVTGQVRAAALSGDSAANLSADASSLPSGGGYFYCANGQEFASMYIDYSSSYLYACRGVADYSVSVDFGTDAAACLAAYNDRCLAEPQGEIPPSFDSTPTVAATSSTAISVSLDVDRAAKIYWVVTTSNQSVLNTDVKAGNLSDQVGSGVIESTGLNTDFAANFSVTGLNAGSDYFVYLVAENANDATKLSGLENESVSTFAVPSFVADPTATSILTPTTEGGRREMADVFLQLDSTADVSYVVLPENATAPTAAQVQAGQDASGSAVPLAGAFSDVPSGQATRSVSGLDAEIAYTVYMVAASPGDGALRSGVKSVNLAEIAGDHELSLYGWQRLADPTTDALTYFDLSPTIAGTAPRNSTLYFEIDGELVGRTVTSDFPRNSQGTPKCPNLEFSCASFQSAWRITLEAGDFPSPPTVGESYELMVRAETDDNSYSELSTIKFEIATPPESFNTTLTPGGEDGDKFDLTLQQYNPAPEDLLVLTWDGDKLREINPSTTGTLTYRGRVTNWGDGGGAMVWATLYPDGYLHATTNYGKAGSDGQSFEIDINDNERFGGFTPATSQPIDRATGLKELTASFSSYPDAMTRQVWRYDRIEKTRDYYDVDLGYWMILGAANSIDWIMARDLGFSFGIKTIVLPAQNFYLADDCQSNNLSTSERDKCTQWRRGIKYDDDDDSVSVHLDENTTYCPLSGCTVGGSNLQVPSTKTWIKHIIGGGLGGGRDLDSRDFYKIFTNLTRAKAGTGLHEIGHTGALGHCNNQPDTMCGGGGFWFGRDSHKRFLDHIAAGSQGGATLVTSSQRYSAPVPPYVPEDYARVTPGSSTLIDVLANDIDYNDDSANPVSLRSVSSSSLFGGSVAIENGQIRYTPAPGFSGKDYFEYTAQSGLAGSLDYFTNSAPVVIDVFHSDPNSPVLHFNFEENKHDIVNDYSRTADTTLAYIESSSALNFATAGASVSGAAGQALRLDGDSNVIIEGYPEALDKSQSISLWFNLVDAAGLLDNDGAVAALFDTGTKGRASRSNSGISAFISRVDSEHLLNVVVQHEANGGTGVLITEPLDTNTLDQWRHLSLVIDREGGHQVRAYLDSQQLMNGFSGENPFSNGIGVLPSDAVVKGQNTAAIGNTRDISVAATEENDFGAVPEVPLTFTGAIDEFKIFNAALSSQQVIAEYNNGSPTATAVVTSSGVAPKRLVGGDVERQGRFKGLHHNWSTKGRVNVQPDYHPDYRGEKAYPHIADGGKTLLRLMTKIGIQPELRRMIGYYKDGLQFDFEAYVGKRSGSGAGAIELNIWAGGSRTDTTGAVKIASSSVAMSGVAEGGELMQQVQQTLQATGADTSSLTNATPLWFEIAHTSSALDNSVSFLDGIRLTETSQKTPPTISGTPRVQALVGQSYSFTPQASDADGDTLVFSIANRPSWASFDVGTGELQGVPAESDAGSNMDIVISVSDGIDTVSLSVFNILVESIAPVITVPENLHVAAVDAAGTPASNGAITAFLAGADATDINGDVLTVHNDAPLVFPLGVSDVTFSATDQNSESNSKVASVTVSDQTAPVITLLGSNELSIGLGGTFVDPGYRADDNVDGAVAVTVAGTVMTDSSGDYTLNYAAVDSAGNSATISRRVVVLETGADSDGDGMPDAFEREVGLNPNDASDASKDRDGDGASNLREYNLGTDLDVDTVAPRLTIPDDLSVPSLGRITRVELGVATAIDRLDGVLIPNVSSRGEFKPGRHTVQWQVSDNAGNTTTREQRVDVIPQIELMPRAKVQEGASTQIVARLNGDAAVYPVTVPLVLSGSATMGDDFENIAAELVVDNVSDGGRMAVLAIDTLDDAIVEGDEVIRVQLGEVSNAIAGASVEQRITIIEAELPPLVELNISQLSRETSTVYLAEGDVSVAVELIRSADGATITYDWSNSDTTLLSSIASGVDSFVIDPSVLQPGAYQLVLDVTQSGSESLSTRYEETLLLMDAVPQLSSEKDSDGDGISDAVEGLSDADGDGIADYLDEVDDPTQLPTGGTAAPIEAQPGISLALGLLSKQSGAGKAQLTKEELGSVLAVDGDAIDTAFTYPNGMVDFTARGLEAGESLDLVIPQPNGIPPNAVYRKVIGANEWRDFVVDSKNSVGSAQGTSEGCPPPSSADYSDGLVPGHFCLNLRIEDGGPNDGDGLVNGTVVDPGGVASAFIPEPQIASSLGSTESQTFRQGDGEQAVLYFSVGSDSVDAGIDMIRLAAEGELDEQSAVTRVTLYVDENSNATPEPIEKLAEGQFMEDDGELVFEFNDPVRLKIGETQFIVTYQF